MKTLLENATVVLADKVAARSTGVLIEDGVIRALAPTSARGTRRVDLGGRLLLPGLIDLHCDMLEKELEPRPGTRLPLDFAVAQADLRYIVSGITTPFYAIAFAAGELGVRDTLTAAALVRAVRGYAPYALADSRVHCRVELSDDTAAPAVLALLNQGRVDMLSLMDHTPGHGQFKNIRDYRRFLNRTYRTSAAQIDALLKHKRAARRAGYARVKELLAAARVRGVPVASHDDDSPARVRERAAIGAQISEFPVNLETAQAARACGIRTVYGAPNILRGASQAGSMRAIDAVRAGLCDCLCADYAPATLLAAIFALVDERVLALPQAARLASLNPARAVGLVDRGELAVGKRADLLVVDAQRRPPKVSQVWVAGRPVFQAESDPRGTASRKRRCA
jgi:alpha-D-ribose 1-methylphosphonate 5-triphosphate diphosphatase